MLNLKNKIVITTILLSITILPAVSITQSNQVKSVKMWIYFKNKGTNSDHKLQKPATLINDRALQRRLKVKQKDQLVSERDLPVAESYIESIEPFVKKVRAKSKWLNAISVEVDPAQIQRIESLDFVKRISPVLSYNKNMPKEESIETSKSRHLKKTSADIDYGNSYTQLELINVPALHEMGFYGQGVLICMLDDGFNLLNMHETFDSLNVVATRDFINDDEFVDDSGLDATEGGHGTKTLSCIAGYSPGILIGSAFKASFLLAKTEVDTSETAIEEDYWVEGIEWAESNGADIASSSLGYIDWYSQKDMDGNTAVTTIAADIAVDLGMIVVNSAGNEGYSSTSNTLIAPSDGDNVIAVGAVTGLSERSSFSSVGPSADGRIKPDVAAMGTRVLVASSYDSVGYTNSNGTSFSCPLTSGAIALLLSAYPQLTPEQVYYAITSTASQSSSPDYLLGWGIIDIEAAYYSVDTSDLKDILTNHYPDFIDLKQNFPNPFNPETTISYSLDNRANVEINIYDILGGLVASFPQGLKHRKRQYDFKHNFSEQASGIYIYQVRAREYGTSNISKKSKKMILLK